MGTLRPGVPSTREYPEYPHVYAVLCSVGQGDLKVQRDGEIVLVVPLFVLLRTVQLDSSRRVVPFRRRRTIVKAIANSVCACVRADGVRACVVWYAWCGVRGCVRECVWVSACEW